MGQADHTALSMGSIPVVQSSFKALILQVLCACKISALYSIFASKSIVEQGSHKNNLFILKRNDVTTHAYLKLPFQPALCAG
jgi:hypothetical protein